MGLAAARMNDMVSGIDIHLVMVPAPPGPPVPTPLPHPFTGMITSGVSSNVQIGGQPAATVGSSVQNNPPHMPTPPGTSFLTPPSNTGTVFMGSFTVLINGKGAARQGDMVQTCADPAPMPNSTIADGFPTVLIG